MIANQPPGAFAAIVAPDEADVAGLEMFDAFGLEDRDAVSPYLQASLAQGVVHDGYGSFMRPLPPPSGEPDVTLNAWPNTLRCGIVTRLTEVDGRKTLTSASVYFSDGAQNRFTLEAIHLSRYRDQALLEGAIGEMPVIMYEPLFAAERGLHGHGSIHEILLYGVAYSLKIGAPPPMRVANPLKRASGEMIDLRFDHMASIFPIREAPAGYYSIVGPVKEAKRFELDMFDAPVYRIRMTCARLGGQNDQDCDLDVYVPARLMNEDSLPTQGEIVQTSVRLCARLWMANVRDGG